MSKEVPARGYLLDTHVALWALDRPESLSKAARKASASGPNFLSVVSFWEIMVKCMKGTLKMGDPRNWWKDALDQLDATPLVLRHQHVAAVYTLPPIHKDPFDRMLIAQAIVEGLCLVSMDRKISGYASSNLRIVG